MSEVKNPKQSELDPALRSMLGIQETDDKDFIYCAACATVITAPSQRIEVNGRHDHYFINPHGFEFHVGCFRHALGCDISGQPEAADSWFMGYVWRLATCGGCQAHLGWYFATGTNEDAFYGLILNALTSKDI